MSREPMLIVGLGNPGPEYEGTRHNMGFMVTGELARRYGIGLDCDSLHSRWGKGKVGEVPVVVAWPMTYMNRSGLAVGAVLRAFGLTPHSLVVVHDELDLPLGRLKVSLGAGPGGHKGVASIQQTINSKDFPRLRVGIGRPPAGTPVVEYVLGEFTPSEQATAHRMVHVAADCLECLLLEGPQAAMQKFHRPLQEEEG